MSETRHEYSDTAGTDEQQRLLRDSACAFAKRELHPGRLRSLRSGALDFDAALWKKMAEMGWAGLLVPESYGGHGLRLGDMSVVVEELASALLPEPVVSVAVLSAGALVYAEDESIKQALLPALCAGELIVALAWQEHGVPLAAAVRAATASGGLALTGQKKFIRPATGVDGFIVSALADEGLCLCWVPADTAGLSLTLEVCADGSRIATLTLDHAKVPSAHIIATPRTAARALRRAINEATLIASAELVGISKGAFRLTLDYLNTRVQFGRPIGSFQALQHRAVDLYIQVRLASAALASAPAAFDEADATTRAMLVSRVKARCSDAALLVTREAIQLHGAIGFTDEHDIGLYLNRALTLAPWLGNSAKHRKLYRAALSERAHAGSTS